MSEIQQIELKRCPFCGTAVSIAPMTGRHIGRYSFCHPEGAHVSILGDGHFTCKKCIVRDAIIFDCYRDAEAWAEIWNNRPKEGGAN